MANLLDMSQFSNLKELQEYAQKLFQTNMMLQMDIKQKQDKIEHLESLIKVIPGTDLMMDDKEIEICKIEINRLYQKSIRMPLEDKEIRNLEILVKTLSTAKGKSISDVKEKKDKDAMMNMDVGKLVQLARTIKED